MIEHGVYDLTQTGQEVQNILDKGEALPTNQQLQKAFASKQDKLTFDNVPTPDSDNAITSGAVYDATTEEYEGPVTELPDASAETLHKIYLVGEEGATTYDRYYTSFDGTTYSWVPMGSTQINISGKTDKLGSGHANNVATFNSDGNLKDSSIAVADVESSIVYDISRANSVGDVLAEYADLSAALGVDGANIPEDLRRGGMSVKFVQSSDNKYVQYRLMSNTFSTDISYWEGMAIPPVSNNSIFNNIVKNLYIGGLSVSEINKIWFYKGYLDSGNYYSYGFFLRTTDNVIIDLRTINDSSVLNSKYYYKKSGNLVILAELVWDNASPRTEFENIVLSEDVNNINAFPVARLMAVDDEPTAGSENLVESGGIVTYLNTILQNYDLINLYPYSFKGIIHYSDGHYEDHPDDIYRVTDYIPVTEGIFIYGKIAVLYTGFYNIAGYNEDKVFVTNVKRFESVNVSEFIQLDSRIKYIRIQTNSTYVSTNRVFPLYSSHERRLLDKDLWKSYMSKMFIEQKTLVECQNPQSLNSWVVSGYSIAISNEIKKGTYIPYIKFNVNMTPSNTHYVCFVGNNGLVVSKFQITGSFLKTDFIVPKDGFFMYSKDEDSPILESGTMNYTLISSEVQGNTSVFKYIQHQGSNIYNVGDLLPLPNYKITEKVNVNVLIPGVENNIVEAQPYEDNIITFLGDSITQGLTWLNNQWAVVSRPYPVIVGEILSCKTFNKGYGSYPISASGGSENSLLNVYQTINASSKYIVVFAGTNDFYFNVPIGSVTDNADVSFCGAVNALINGIATNYPNVQIVFMTPLHRQTEDTPNGVNKRLVDYVNAIKEVCNRCAIPVIDLYACGYISYNVTEFQHYLSDGLHPTQEGYDRLGKVIAKKLSGILISEW